MRYKKSELLHMLQVLNKVNESLKSFTSANLKKILQMLTQCQEIALKIGNDVETKGETGRRIVQTLELYCEDIYQQSIHIEDGTVVKQISKKIKKELLQINNLITNDLSKEKKEIVFLPYSASMWDSMESVWMAANEDENCEVSVVPIPYYDKNKDGQLTNMHYEGDKYPDYVPITLWKEYDISKKCPDIIYIHNPYDDCNHVTSVHPNYFAKVLSQYTSMLVYIPYYVVNNNEIEDGFCVTPGVQYADRVIVQSEEVRKRYINVIVNYEREYSCIGAFGNVEEKIVALGSPKFDKLYASNMDDIKLPKEWKRKIYKPNGKKKKLVLYNTTINAMINNGERMIEKIKHTLEVFKSQSDVVLLWRPHPLMKDTLKTMMPLLYQEYIKLETLFIEGDYGIYDETSDLHRAIQISDVYYGDGGSVFELFRNTGKPIMIQDCTVLRDSMDTEK